MTGIRTSCGADIGDSRAEQRTRALGRSLVRGSVRGDLHRVDLGDRLFRSAVITAIVGVTDSDPFVLSIAQDGASSLTGVDAAVALLTATASNNVLKQPTPSVLLATAGGCGR